jgi:hypothetical protein
MAKLPRLKRVQQRLAELNRRIAVESPHGTEGRSWPLDGFLTIEHG